jgi:hypothetical protein
MPFPERKLNDTQTLLSHFCFKEGGRISRYGLVREIDIKNNRIIYILHEFHVINKKSVYTGKKYLVDEREVSFLINLYDEGDHQEEEYKFPTLDLQTRESKDFDGVFKYVPLSEDCSFKPFVLGHPPPSDNAVGSLLEFAAGKGINTNNNARKRKTRKRKIRVRKSRRNKC